MATTRTYTTKIAREGSMCFIPVPFDPKEVFGKVRAPVKVTVGTTTYRTTIFSMGGVTGVPLRKSNREAAGLAGDETTEVRMELDEEPRVIAPPADLKQALRMAGATAAWDALSYTHQREHVEAIEGAKAPETRWRRIAAALAMLGAPAPATKKRAKSKPVKRAPAKSAKSKPTASRPAKTKRAKSKPAKSRPAKSKPAKRASSKAKQPAQSRPAKSKPAKSEPAKRSKPRPAQSTRTSEPRTRQGTGPSPVRRADNPKARRR